MKPKAHDLATDTPTVVVVLSPREARALYERLELPPATGVTHSPALSRATTKVFQAIARFYVSRRPPTEAERAYGRTLGAERRRLKP